MSSAHLNLSLLSRGVGEVQQNGHEKIEVKLEPEVCSVVSASILPSIASYAIFP